VAAKSDAGFLTLNLQIFQFSLNKEQREPAANHDANSLFFFGCKCVFFSGYNYNLSNSGQIYKHVEHVFGSIGPTGAEIWPCKGYRGLNKTRPVIGLSKIQPVKGLSKTRPYRTEVFLVTRIYDFGRDKEKELVAANSDAGSLTLTLILQIFQFSLKDGSIRVNTKVGNLFLLSRIQILVDNLLENINIFIIRDYIDKNFESDFSSIGANIVKIKSIEYFHRVNATKYNFKGEFDRCIKDDSPFKTGSMGISTQFDVHFPY
jgi:hypothetical protein